MLKNPLLENIQQGRTSLGTAVNDPDTLELCAHLGFEWVFIDQMFVAQWKKLIEDAGIRPEN
jgi:2-keto-3-deoxy-L-rhamnonate aldolase RhmA